MQGDGLEVRAHRSAHGPSRRDDGHGRRLAHDPDPRLPLRRLADDRDRDRHRPRSRLQDRRCSSTPQDGQRAGAARGLDARRLGADVAPRRLARRPVDGALRRRRGVGHGAGPRRRPALRRGRARREEPHPGESDRRSRLGADHPRPRRRGPDRHARRIHRRPDLGRERRLLRADAARHLPAARAQSRRHGHLPRCGPPLRRGRGALGCRERRLRDPRLAPARLDSRRARRRPADAVDSGERAPNRARWRSRPRRVEASRRSLCRDHRRDRLVGRTRGAPGLSRPAQLGSPAARPQRAQCQNPLPRIPVAPKDP